MDWDQLLVAPEALKTGGGDPYRVYGPFKRNWFGQVERRAEAGELDLGLLPRDSWPMGSRCQSDYHCSET